MSSRIYLILCFLLVANTVYSQADTVIMKDGVRYFGKISTDTKKMIQLISGNESYLLNKKKIDKIVSGNTSPLSFSKVVQVEGVSKKEIYNRARHWFAKTYKNSKRVLQIDNFEQDGDLIGKGSYSHEYKSYKGTTFTCTIGYVDYQINIFVKDGRFKIIISDFIHESSVRGQTGFGLLSHDYNWPHVAVKGYQKTRNRDWRDFKKEAEIYAIMLIEDAEIFITTPLESENDDW